MKKKILIPFAILVLTAVGAIIFLLIPKQKKPELPAPVAAAPAPADQPKDAATRPATAEEIKRCDTERPLTEGIGPVERSWRIGRNNGLESDVCLATYTIHLKNGKTTTIDDSIIDPDEASANSINHIHTYMKEEGFFLVSIDFMEGSSFTLYNDETGEDTPIECSPPVFSPAKTALYSFCTNSDDESSTSSIGVWSRSNGSLKQVYLVSDLPWTPANLKWVDDTTLTLDKQTIGPEAMQVTATVPAKISGTGDTWIMDPPAK